MKPLYSETEWPTLAVYDIEAEYWVNVTLVCHIDEYGNRVHFDSIGKYLDWLFDKFPGNIVFAHAGGHYDHRFLMAEAKERGWDFDTAISGGTIVILTIKNGKRAIRFGDSYRLMPDSLKKIGKTVGLEKLEVNPSQIHLISAADTLDYCFRDCEVVMRGLQLMRQRLQSVGADFAFTLASIASRYNRRNPGIRWEEFVEKQHGKMVLKSHFQLWDKCCYDAYHGGRCEMFRKGTFKGPIYWYDIVSSYPTSMREELPLYWDGFYTKPERWSIESFLGFPGITQCVVEVPKAFLTVLPKKDPNGRLNFPTGTLYGRWTNIELLEAIKHGAKITHINGQWRFKGAPFLRKFVDTFYNLRQQAKDNKDEFGSYTYKILLNSAYGKFVETIDRKSYITKGEIPAAERKGGKVQTTPTQGVFTVTSKEIGPVRHSAVGAYITAYSRLRLFRKAMEMHKKGANIYYTDTDSLMLDMPIEDTGDRLGDWEHVDTLSELELVLPKVYRAVSPTKTVYKCKGCPIVRQWESDDIPQKRWNAFKNFRFHEDESSEDARILGKDGITGIASDIKAGSLMPRRREASCKTCKKTGKYKGLECPACGGKGAKLKPLVRSLKSDDQKRVWDGDTSTPIAYPLPPKVPKGKKQKCNSAST